MWIHRLALTLPLAACAATLPAEPPPLEALEEPPAFLAEPSDEEVRAALAPGTFSGLRVADARESLAALAGDPEGVRVARVVENSPADFAGLIEGDLLLEADAGQGWTELAYPSEWRAIELAGSPGTEVALLYDRAGAERETTLELEQRLRPAERTAVERFTEDARVGVVVRTATEVEARAAGLSPGAGAVLVGMAASSPWRGVDLTYGDLLVAVDGRSLAHPDVLLDAIRAGDDDGALTLTRVRAAERVDVVAPLSDRERRVREVSIPLLYRYERTPDERRWSAVLGLLHYTSTKAAWRFRLLWLFRFGAGDLDRLEEVDG
ncbi:MAG: hypothetical protein AAFZ65_09200 [Planctomycetota bacterium]